MYIHTYIYVMNMYCLPCRLMHSPACTAMQVHLTRMAFANATRPLLRSILMDYVAKRHRGKINALESVRAMSWSGSAALGGWDPGLIPDQALALTLKLWGSVTDMDTGL